jgi:5-(aminomethyl)-3-furanmethanol phosphate kinase
VIKVGGSLFDWNQLAMALGRWLDAQSQACNVLIAGGGALADAIRQADATHALGEQIAHELCVELLGVTARLLEALLAGRSPRITFTDLQKQQTANRLPDCCVLDARDFLLDIESTASLTSLPPTWDVTSDSIAAWVACALAADELVLLKSDDPPGDQSLDALALAQYVDRYFPTAVASFAGTVRMVNLRGFSQS